MKGNRISYYVLGAFIAGTFLLIFIQYNSSKNIDNLIAENKRLVNEFSLTSELNQLERDILALESKVRGVVSTQDSEFVQKLDINIVDIREKLSRIPALSLDDSSVLFVMDLNALVQQKIAFNGQILDSLRVFGKASAERLLATKYGKRLTDSIVILINRITSIRKRQLAETIAIIDRSVEKEQQFNTLLIVLVLVSAAVLFWYIINIIKKQLSLIRQLNISEKKVKEAAELKEKFMANMSHEIRTPMNAILGFTNLLQRKNVDAESKEYLGAIQRSGENLLAIINDILDLSKIEAGMMRIESAPFSIRGLVHSVETMFLSKIKEKQLRLKTVVDETLPDTLEGDATRLTQILVNLIGNAIKFTSTGGIEIRITNEGSLQHVVRTGITITDTGIGINKEKLDKIFERFQQAEDAVTRKYGGTGLGLSIVRDLVMLQNGSIKVESEPGKGTSFAIVIPYGISVRAMEDMPSVSNASGRLSALDNIHILVVEDNEINQSLIRHLFKEWHLSYDLAVNGKEAIRMLQSGSYNLVLMDIQMPEMDGYTATQEIRNRLKSDIPIIAMTAHALAGEREKCLSYGMNEYISKPIREEQLHKLISHFTQAKLAVMAADLMPDSRPAYTFIDLRYIKEIGRGDREYEKDITAQFLAAVPDDLVAMEKAWQEQDLIGLRQLAHNMRTTVSVMGLDERLRPFLDTMEYQELTAASFIACFREIETICKGSVDEARKFYDTLLAD